jgi:hypothetical protein
LRNMCVAVVKDLYEARALLQAVGSVPFSLGRSDG